jgi:hypothetical protein
MSNKKNMKIHPIRTSNTYFPALTAPEIPITLNLKLLMSVHNVQSSSRQCERMMDYIIGHLKKKNNVHVQVDDYGNIYATKGKADLYPAIVSHTDTVHIIHKHFQVYKDNNIIWAYSEDKQKQVGVGGDDKVGVFMCLAMLDLLPKVKVAFFKDEEIGCIGSGYADMTFFQNCGFVLQCDRKGSNDFVYNAGIELYGSNFETAVAPFLAKHGYSESYGLMTDVLELKRKGLKVACANMSCGYYSPHSDNEVLDLNAVQKCYNLVSDLMTNFIDTQFLHDTKHSKGGYSYSYRNGGGHGSYSHGYDDYDYDYDDYDYGRGSYFKKNNVDDIDHDSLDDDDFSDVDVDIILAQWGLTNELNNYYSECDICIQCNEILDEDIDGIKHCKHCNSYKHIPKQYFKI